MAVLAALVVAVVAGEVISRGGASGARHGDRVGVAVTSPAGHPAPTSTPTTAGRPAGRPYPVGRTELTVVEGSRQLPTTVRYPATASGPSAPAVRAGGPFPLIVFSQGFDISAEAYAALLEHWAAAGYVVADPTYPATDPGAAGGVDENDIVNHPADLSAVITAVLRAGSASTGVLSGVPDASSVGIAGHSDGGDVTDAVAANSCCRVATVRAAEVLSGAELASFGGSYDAPGALPVLVAQGSSDPINFPACSEQIYDAAGPARYYLDLLGAGHHAPYMAAGPYQAPPARAAAYQSVVTRVTTDFWDAYLKHSASALAAITVDGSQAGTSTLVAGPAVPVSGYCPGSPAG